jgi:hypothetical protein
MHPLPAVHERDAAGCPAGRSGGDRSRTRPFRRLPRLKAGLPACGGVLPCCPFLPKAELSRYPIQNHRVSPGTVAPHYYRPQWMTIPDSSLVLLISASRSASGSAQIRWISWVAFVLTASSAFARRSWEVLQAASNIRIAPKAEPIFFRWTVSIMDLVSLVKPVAPDGRFSLELHFTPLEADRGCRAYEPDRAWKVRVPTAEGSGTELSFTERAHAQRAVLGRRRGGAFESCDGAKLLHGASWRGHGK